MRVKESELLIVWIWISKLSFFGGCLVYEFGLEGSAQSFFTSMNIISFVALLDGIVYLLK